MRKLLRDNGLSIVLFVLFCLFITAQVLTGHRDDNAESMLHGNPPESLWEYFTSASCWEAIAENWESEFLQMGAFVLLTQFLYQRGSAESRQLPGEDTQQRMVEAETIKAARREDKVPMVYQKGGAIAVLYSHSLTIVFFVMFLVSFIIHCIASWLSYNEFLQDHGQTTIAFGKHLFSARLWFESFQNWQSEFLAIGCMVVLSIFLRAKDSSESKPVPAAHSHTGK